MANFSITDLNFGHFGQAVYDPEEKEWLFNRKPGIRRELHVLGPWTTSLSPSISNGHSDNPQSSRSLQRQAQELVRNNPELVPAFELLPEYARISAATTSSVAVYDSAVGDLLSFGSASDEQAKKRVHLAAIPAGEVGNILRLVRVSEERQGWEDDRSIWLETPTIDEESGWWVGECAPIQQLCFAFSEEKSTFLAVRFLTKTVLFRPVYHESPVAPKRSQFYTLPPSRIDPSPVFTFPNEQTGGAQHAHVTFNPWYQRQIAFIDIDGQWSVWDINGRHGRQHGYEVSLTNKGRVISSENEQEEDQEEEQSQPREDGWARVLWVGDVNTILVCDRRKLALFDVRGKVGVPTQLESPEMISERTAEWILDVKPSSQNSRHFFVLTSSRLFLLAVHCLNETFRSGDTKAGASILLSWRHFRSMEDVTLQLSIIEDDEDESLVLMHSRLNTLVTVFRFSTPNDDFSLPTSESDPTILEISNDLLSTGGAHKHITNVYLNRLQFGEDLRLHGRGLGTQYMNDDVRFYKLTLCLSDLSVHETLVYSLNLEKPPRQPVAHDQSAVEGPSWRVKSSKIYQKHLSSRKLVEDDDFVVPEGMHLGISPVMRRSMRSKASLHRRPSLSGPETPKGDAFDPLTISNEFMYDELFEKNALNSIRGSENNSESVLNIVERIKSLTLQNYPWGEEPFSTLLDFAASSIKVEDFDDASIQFHELIQSFKSNVDANSPSLEIYRVASEDVLQLDDTGNDEPSMASAYDNITPNWIVPLPPKVPVRLRFAKEKQARLIAAEVILGSSRVRLTEPPAMQAMESQTETGQTDSISLPILPSRKGKERGGSVFSDQSSLPPRFTTPDPGTTLPTPATTPSLTSGTTFTSSNTSIPASNPISRLRQHLQITKSPTLQPPSVTQVLMHWQQHHRQNPKAYDWDATTRTVREELQLDEEGMSASRRARLQRKAERHLKRQRRETAAAATAVTASQPLLVQELAQMRSSPGPAVMRSQGSSQATQGFSQFGGVASQVERGAFGARPVKKARKAKVPGFR